MLRMVLVSQHSNTARRYRMTSLLFTLFVFTMLSPLLAIAINRAWQAVALDFASYATSPAPSPRTILAWHMANKQARKRATVARYDFGLIRRAIDGDKRAQYTLATMASVNPVALPGKVCDAKGRY